MEPRPVNNSKTILIIAITALMTGLVVGSGVFFWQQSVMQQEIQQAVEKARQEAVNTPAPTPSQSDTSNWQTYHDEEGKLEFKYPENWTAKESGIAGETVLSAKDFSRKGEQGAPISLIIHRNEKNLGLQEYFDVKNNNSGGLLMDPRAVEYTFFKELKPINVTIANTASVKFENGDYEITVIPHANRIYEVILLKGFKQDQEEQKILTGMLYTFKFVETQTSVNTSNEPIPSSTTNKIQTIDNLKDYSLISYPLKQSPIYNQLDKDCFDSYWASAQDTRLVKNQKQILIPSLLQLISSNENQKPNCAMHVNLFSAPTDGKYLYLQTSYNTGSDVPYSGLSGIYRLDLSNLSIKKLSVSDLVGNFDLYRGSAADSYKLLSDEKMLVKWTMDRVYLINLETDSRSTLYAVQQNQWLISSIEFSMGQNANYDVQVNGDRMVVGVYDKTKTQEGKKITIDQYENVTVEGANQEDDIKPRFINRVTIQIP